MTERAHATVELRFDDGDKISAWESFTLRDSYVDPLGSFEFTVSPPKHKRAEYRDRLQKGEEVTIAVNGAQQARCLIDTVEQELGDDGYSMAIECRSLLAPAYEASVDPYVAQSFTADTPMRQTILEILGPFGFDEITTDTTADVTTISGKSLSGRKDPVTLDKLTHRDVAAQQNEAAYQLCARLVTRLGLMLRVNHDGKLLLGSPDYDQASSYTIVQEVGQVHRGDRILRAPAIQTHDTNEGQYSEVLVAGKTADHKGQTGASQPIGGVYLDDITRPSAAPFGSATLRKLTRGRHSYRGPWKPKYYLDKKSRDAERCTNFSELMQGVRASRAFYLRHAVDGLLSASGGRIWAVDTVGRVIAEDFGIDQNMWLLERVMRQDRRGGQTTVLTWLPLGALRLGESG